MADERKRLNLKLFAVSVDDEAVMKAFAARKAFDFDLLADPGGRVAKSYGVWRRGYARRVSFVLDETGAVRHVDEHVRVTRHGSDLLAQVRTLRK